MTRPDLVKLASASTIVAGSGGVPLLSSPSPAFAAPAIQGEPIELTYWHGWTEQWEEMVQFVVDMFHAKQDRIRIKP
jgi:hypothetical protein